MQTALRPPLAEGTSHVAPSSMPRTLPDMLLGSCAPAAPADASASSPGGRRGRAPRYGPNATTDSDSDCDEASALLSHSVPKATDVAGEGITVSEGAPDAQRTRVRELMRRRGVDVDTVPARSTKNPSYSPPVSSAAPPRGGGHSMLGDRQIRGSIVGLLPSEAACCITGGSAPPPPPTKAPQPQQEGAKGLYQRRIVTPPPHISKSALRKAVALFRFILFPDYLWQPERHRHAPVDAAAAVPAPLSPDGTAVEAGPTSPSPNGAVPHYFERSPLADARVSERHRVLRSMVTALKGTTPPTNEVLGAAASAPPQEPHSCPQREDAKERDEAVLAALIRLTEILEVQIYRGFLAVAYEDGIRNGGVHRSKASTVRPVRKEGNNGGRPKFDLNWLPDLNAPTESAAVAAGGCTCVCSVADPAALRVRARNIAMFLIERLPKLRILLHLDVEAVFLHDVAAHSIGEVVLCYPGIYFMAHQRLAHELYLLGAPNHVTRLLTEIAHTKTGIDIHPHTSIGHSFFMDHCTGIVIGATSIIGNRVSIYQGVTLGAKAFPLDPVTGEKIKNLPRHPIIEDDVTIYANASVLGRVTIGAGSVIGGNVWLAKSIPPSTTVLQGPTHLKMIASKKDANADSAAAKGKGKAASTSPSPPSPATGASPVDATSPPSMGSVDAEGAGAHGYPSRDVAEVSDEAPEKQSGGGAMRRHRAAHLLGESFVSHL